MLTLNAIVTVSAFNGGTVDRNGKAPVIMTPFKGSVPNRGMVIAGTISENLGFELGNNYLVQFREVEGNEYGRQFRHTNLGKIDAIDLATKDFTSLGEAQVIDVSKEIETSAKADMEAEGEEILNEEDVVVSSETADSLV